MPKKGTISNVSEYRYGSIVKYIQNSVHTAFINCIDFFSCSIFYHD